MRIGEMRERISIREPVRTSDGSGGFTVEWAPVATVWGAVIPQSGKEAMAADQVEASGRYLVRTRHRSGITSAMRVQWKRKTLQIRAISDLIDRLEIIAEEVGNDGAG